MIASEYYQAIFNALSNRRMDDIAKAAFSILQMPIVVTDSTFVVMAKHPLEPLGDEQWDANTVNSQIEPRFVKTFSDDDHFLYHAQTSRPILINWGYYENTPRLTAVVRSDDVILGYCSALTTGYEVEEWHYEFFEVVAEAFAILMDADLGTHTSKAGFSSAVLYALLSGSGDALADYRQLADGWNGSFHGPYVFICGRTKDTYNAPLESYFAQATAQDFEPSIQTVIDGLLHILVADAGSDYREETKFHLAVQNLKSRGVVCGISSPFESLEDILDYKWQAERALTVGSSLRPDKFNYHYEDYIADIVLDALISSVPATAFNHPMLMALKQEDEQNGTDYYLTFKTYVSTCGDRKQTAEILHVHRNTLAYRLSRIAELMGLEVLNPSQLVSFGLFFEAEDLRYRMHDADTDRVSNRRKVNGTRLGLGFSHDRQEEK